MKFWLTLSQVIACCCILIPASQLVAEASFTCSSAHQNFIFNSTDAIVIADGAIFRTTDGGVTWSALKDSTTVPTDLKNIYFLDKNTGWALTAGNQVVRTLDGGATWELKSAGASSSFSWFYFINAETGWTQSDSLLYRTVNGGASWTLQLDFSKFSQDYISSDVRAFIFSNETEGLMVLENSIDHRDRYAPLSDIIPLYTVDGGATWQDAVIEPEETDNTCDNLEINVFGLFGIIYDSYFTDATNGWLMAYDKEFGSAVFAFATTTDGGKSWRQKNCLPSRYAIFSNSTASYSLNTWSKSLFISLDNGRWWTPTCDVTQENESAFFIAKENNGRTFDSDCRITTWHQLYESENPMPPNPLFTDNFEDGDANDWQPLTAERWKVNMDSGNHSYFLNSTDHESPGNGQLGEYSIVKNRVYSNFEISCRIKSTENFGSNPYADFAIICSFQNTLNYYYVLFNAKDGYTGIYKVVDGVRRTLKEWDGISITDNNFVEYKVKRLANRIIVSIPGHQEFFGWDNWDNSGNWRGSVGIGSINDAAIFDDFRVTGQMGNFSTHVSIPGVAVEYGNTVEIPVLLSSSSSITYSQLVIEYDHSMMQFIGAKTGTASENFSLFVGKNLVFPPVTPGNYKNRVDGSGR